MTLGYLNNEVMKAFKTYGDRTEPHVRINVPFGEIDFKPFGKQGST
jgi:hypothetical protein